MKKWLLITGIVLLCWWSMTTDIRAQGSSLRLETRIDRLESELSRVRSQLTQLEARTSGPSALPPATSAPGSPNELSLAEQFDNLATLAIEVRQDVRDLQGRVAELEGNPSR
ncbi:MAG: hypothetical protein AAF609_25465 [Cyanobacteria bacterium P01_C01_bin.120]